MVPGGISLLQVEKENLLFLLSAYWVVLPLFPWKLTIVLRGRPIIIPNLQLRKLGSEKGSDLPKATQLLGGKLEPKVLWL